MAKRVTALPVWLAFVLVLLAGTQARAQDGLELYAPVEGRLSAGETQDWTFGARDGQVLSFSAQGTGVDPQISILTPDGDVLISNDDYDYPASRDALLEAVTLPRTATYTLRVSAVSGAGSYRLTMLPGYAQIARLDNFNGEGGWQPQGTAADNPLSVETTDGRLVLALDGIAVSGTATDGRAAAQTDSFAQVGVAITSGGGWTAGISARQQSDGTYYAGRVSHEGLWQLIAVEGGAERVLRDWTPHPAITAGETTFTLGLLVNGDGLELFYNGVFVGKTTDSALRVGGQIGVLAGTANEIGGSVRAAFDNLLVTIPLGVFPQALIPASPQAMVTELQRRRVIPAEGSMALLVESSSAQDVRAGVSRFMLGRGATFNTFALGTRVSSTVGQGGVGGCGLILRSLDDAHYVVAYLDSGGGYGLSQRAADVFQPGLFGENAAWGGGSHALLVVVRDTQMDYYVDGQHVGRLPVEAAAGSVGNAVVNFDPVTTVCTFEDTWLWTWQTAGSSGG